MSNCGTGDYDIENGWEPANYNDYKLSNNEEITDLIIQLTGEAKQVNIGLENIKKPHLLRLGFSL